MTVVFRADPARLPKDAAAAYHAFIAAGGTTMTEVPTAWHGSLIVDGLFGIGLTRALDAGYASIVEWANAHPAAEQAPAA